MPMCDIKDHKTGKTLKAYDFGGPEIYYAGTSLVYAPLGGTSVSSSENLATLNPLGITSIMKPRWEVTGHVGIGTAGWRVSVVDTSTGNTKDGVYPFNLQGNVYELECQPGTWVMASCGGYKIESSWVSKTAEQVYRLKGTGEIMYTYSTEVWGWVDEGYTISYAGGIGQEAFDAKSWYTGGNPGGWYEYVNHPWSSMNIWGAYSTWQVIMPETSTGRWTEIQYSDGHYNYLYKLISIDEPLMQRTEVKEILTSVIKNYVKSNFGTSYTHDGSQASMIKKKLKPSFEVTFNTVTNNFFNGPYGEKAVVKNTAIIRGLAVSYMSDDTIKAILSGLIGD